MNISKKIRVVVIDDSSVIRAFLSHILNSTNDIEVVATAVDPYEGRDKIVEYKPDVITLDVEMPKMDGITFLEKLMCHFPIPTVIISSLTQKGSETALKALDYGAVAVVPKPAIDVTRKLETIGDEIIRVVRSAAKANVGAMKQNIERLKQKKHTPNTAMLKTTKQIVAIASSTGGTQALKVLFSTLPSDIPPMVVVQHMPPVFTHNFAESMNEKFPFCVKEAEEGDQLICGRVLIAPGNFHMEVRRSGANYYVTLNQEPHVHGVRPAADHLFESLARNAGRNVIGIVLTGMGKDGAAGLKRMRNEGSFNIAQDEKTSIVFGMPKEAIKLDAIDKVVPLEKIGEVLCFQLNRRSAA